MLNLLKINRNNAFIVEATSNSKFQLFGFFICMLFLEMHWCLKYFLKKSNIPIVKFILFGQGKSGCSLLADLLISHPQLQYDDEIFCFNVLPPKLILKIRCGLSKKVIYGIKIKIAQLGEGQRIKNPKQFMHELHKKGWKIIYLKRRNILRQEVEQIILRYGDHKRCISHNVPSKLDKIYIDRNDLINKLKKREVRLTQETEVLKDLPHLSIVFEDDLLKTENHQKTVDKAFAYLGLPSVPTKTILVKSLSERLSISIQNDEEVKLTIKQTKYAKFLED